MFSNHGLLVIIALELGYLIVSAEYNRHRFAKLFHAWGQIIQEEIRAVQKILSDREDSA